MTQFKPHTISSIHIQLYLHTYTSNKIAYANVCNSSIHTEWYASKRMAQFVKLVRRFLIRNTFIWFVQEARNCGAFCQTRCNSANASHFHGKRHRNPAKGAAIYKTAHCGASIKVQRFWWEKSGAHAAMFSSAAAVRLLHSS